MYSGRQTGIHRQVPQHWIVNAAKPRLFGAAGVGPENTQLRSQTGQRADPVRSLGRLQV